LRDLAEEADVFYFHGASIFSAIFINKSIISKKIGVIVNPHGMEEFSAQKASMLFRAGLLRIMIRHGSKFANYALATDAALIPNVVKNLGVSESKVRVVVNAMEFESRSQPGTFQTKRFHSTVRRLTSVGRLEWNKGYDILASALVILSESDPEISLEWIHFGSGSQKKNIMTILEKSSNLNVTFFENSSDEQVKDTLSGADLFVQPSRSEGSSLTTLEALSQGILVVATRTGGIPDKVQDGRNGYLAEPGNLYSLIQTIKKALLQPPANYREESERIMVEKFSAKIAMMQFDDVLKAIKSSREA
jgi:glycosyltransferase involved in cell wall biosynthesis